MTSSAVDFIRSANAPDWSQIRWDAGWYCLPVTSAALVFGVVSHQLWVTMVLVGAAVTVGFGAFHQLTRWRWVPMGVATVGFAVSAWTGAVYAHRYLASDVAIAVVWGTVLGVATELGQGAWWIGLQCVIALCVSAAYPAALWPATERALLVLLAGGLQMGVTAAIWWFRGESPVWQKTFEPLEWKLYPTKLGFRFPLDDVGLRYTFRVAAVLAAAVLVHRRLWPTHWANGYWIPMTAAIVLKSDLRTTMTRGIARLSGTLVGVAGVTLLTAVLRPSPVLLAGLILLSLWASFTMQKVNYGLFATFITAYVVLLLSLGGLPERGVAERRTLATIIGGALALGSYAVFPAAKAPAGSGEAAMQAEAGSGSKTG